MKDGIKWTDVVMAFFTVVIAVAAILQWREMVGGGRQTDKLVDYAKVHANAARDQADAAQQFSDTAEDINGRMSDTVEKLDVQAKATQRASRSAVEAMAKQLAAYEDSQAARLSFDDVKLGNDRTELSYTVINRGNSIALNITTGGRAGEWKTWDDPRMQIAKLKSEMKSSPTGFGLAQGERKSEVLNIPPKGSWWHYITYSYADIFGREQEAHLCWFRASGGIYRAGGICPQGFTSTIEAKKNKKKPD